MTGWTARRTIGGGRLAAGLLTAFLPMAALAQDPEVTPPPVPDTSAPVDQGAVSLPLPPVTFSVFGDIAEGYTTNSDSGGVGDDSFTRGRIGLDLIYNKPRLQANVDYELTGEYWAKFHHLNHLSHRLNASSRLTVVPEMLFIGANAFASPAELTRVGDISAGGESVSRYNTRDTFGYSVHPQLVFHFEDFAISSLTASQGGVFFVRPSTATTGTPPPITPASDAFSTVVMEELSSGTYFGRLHWSLTGSYSQFSQTTRTQRQTEGLANLTYAVTRAIRVFVTGGYSEYKSTVALAKDLSGPTALGGITYTLGPDFEVTVEAGTQHNFPTYMGSANWKITPRTSFVAQATDSITTPQGDLLSRLGNGGDYGAGGGFGSGGTIGAGLGLGSFGGSSPFGPGGLSLDNGIYRIRSIEGSLMHSEELTHYTLSVYGTERDRLDMVSSATLPRTSVYGIRGTVTRDLMAKLHAMVGAGYSRANEFGGRDDIISADAQLTYNLSQSIDLYLTNNLVHRNSAKLIGVPNVPLTEDQVIIGLRARI